MNWVIVPPLLAPATYETVNEPVVAFASAGNGFDGSRREWCADDVIEAVESEPVPVPR